MIYANEDDTYHDGGNHQGLVLETLDNLGVSFTKVPAHIHTASLSPSADLAKSHCVKSDSWGKHHVLTLVNPSLFSSIISNSKSVLCPR